MRTVLLATQNNHKKLELMRLLGDKLPWKILTYNEVIKEEVTWEETGETYRDNARIKALALRKHTNLAVIADDSGIEVDALGGEPGVHSARFARPGASDAENVAKILEFLQGLPEAKRTARFRCHITFIEEDGKLHDFEGTCEGVIAAQASGGAGFGYDPVFLIPGLDKTLAEISGAEKDRLSHRGRAVQELVNRFSP
jgi:XTP/dITP diphosphohydrolase